MFLWPYGSMEMESYGYGTMELWHYGNMALWHYVTMDQEGEIVSGGYRGARYCPIVPDSAQ
jgi:hypothetical protein